MSAAKHAFVPTACDTCHEAGLTFYLGASTPALQGRPPDHLTSGNTQMVSGDCSGCHTTTDWTSNILPAGHMPNPGNQACAVCHTAISTTYASYATLASIPVLHTNITTGCAQCHGATTQLTFYGGIDDPKDGVLTPAHIPYISGTDCASCHAPTYVAGGFGPTSMSAAKHAFVPTACDSCHEAGLSFYMGASTPALQGRPADHMAPTGTPAQQTGDCSGCHSTTDWITTVMPAGHQPNPGNQACSVCHTAIGSTAASYATLAPIPALHTGITSNCGLCHGSPSAGQLTFYNNSKPKAAVLTPLHIPYSNGTDCSNCHTSNYVTGGFGPTNMSPAKHAFVPTTCDTCHEAGMSWYLGASTPVLQVRPANHISAPNPASQATGDCSLCHNTTVWTTPTTLPNGHMPIPGTQVCTVCHTGNLTTPTGYATLAPIPALHTGITSGCNQCHGGATQLTFYNNYTSLKAAASLSPPHIPAFTGEDCSACHSPPNYVTGGFGPMNMTQATHAGVGSTCNSCHEAGLSFYMGAASPKLQGRPADHTSGNMVAPNDCSLCHTTASWNSTTLPSGHMPNPANTACNTCHTAAPTNYTTLAANLVMHTGISSGCAACHGGTTALTWYNAFTPKDAVLAPAHIPYLSGTDCGSCHKSVTYAAGTFGPMNMTQATHAFVATACSSCHGTATVSFYMGAASPALQLRPADHTSGTMLTGDCSGCHTTANWNSNTLPAGHMPNPGNQTCVVCHTASPANYTTLATNAVLHTGVVSSQCAQCHGATTPLTWYNNFTPKDAVLAPAHIAFLSGTSCGSCHTSTTYAVGGFGPMNMTQATHAFVSTACSSCHGTATVTVYMGAASPGLQLRPADHTSGAMLTGDCSGCHTTANWNSTSGALPAGHMPNPGSQGCNTCHTAAPTNYTTLAANAVLHTGITTGCITCHGAPNATAPVFYLNYTPKAAAGLAPPHIPTSTTACENCHAISFTSFSGTTMSAAKHTVMLTVTGGTCDQCHDLKTLSFYGVTNLTTRPNGHHAGQDCNGCHSPNNWNGAAAKKKVAATTATKSTIGTVVSAPATRSSIGPMTRSGIATALAGTPATGNTLAAAVSTPATSATTTTAAPSGAAPAVAATAAPSHAGVTGNCVSCHNGVLATGKGPTHIASSSACQNCHTTMAWLPARFDHQGVTASCVSCHNGVQAMGKPTKHIQTTQDCSACHGTITWAAATFSHLGLTATCRSCHNGITATGKQIQHVSTTLDCGSCHNTLSWTVVSTPPTPARPKPLIPSPRGTTGGSIK
jgi:hypothetical protein